MPPDMGTELNRRLDCLDAKISDITREMNALKQQMAVLIDRSDREAEHCPYRVDIARATNGVQRTEKAAGEALKMAQDNRVKIAEYVGAGGLGGVIVLLGQLVFQLIK